MKKMRERLGLESIFYQSNTKGKELELLINQLRSKPYTSKTSQKSKEVKALEASIFKLFGLKIELKTDTPVLAAIELPLVKLNHIFFEPEIKEFIKEDIAKNKRKIKDHVTKASVDLKNSFVSGYFSEVTCVVYMSWKSLLSVPKFTDAEVTAILLHELGHGFTTFEYMSRMVATNQALATIATSLLNKDKISEYEFILQKTGKEFLNDEKRFDSLKDITDSKVVVPFVFATIMKETKSELGTKFYDKVSCEYLADQFVTRLQYGKDIVTGLDKLYGYMSPDKTPWMQIIYDVMGVMILGGLSVLYSGGLSILTIIPALFFTWMMVEGGKFTNYDFTYDHLKYRYARVKEQIINDLKAEHYSSDEISEKIKAIDDIDKIISETYVVYPWMTRLIKTFIPSQKRAEEKFMLQRTLEELASNSLFVRSAQLRTLNI